LAPARLSQVGHLAGIGGRIGITLAALRDTLADVHAALAAESIAGGHIATGARFGGLRAGHAVYFGDALHLVGYSYVPGITISGVQPALGSGRAARLDVAGADAARGHLVVTATGAVRGVLGGQRVVARLRLPVTGP
jgi:hypothetical protein